MGLLVMGPLSAAAQDPSASIPSREVSAPLARHWQGTAEETPGIYLGPVKAKVTLDLNPDGTFVETWKQADDPFRPREALQRRGNTLYTVETEPLPKGRDTTVTIELRPARS